MVNGPNNAEDRQEVIVTFFDKRKRDTVISGSTNLSEHVDRDGRPTAGVRLEIPRGTQRLIQAAVAVWYQVESAPRHGNKAPHQI